MDLFSKNALNWGSLSFAMFPFKKKDKKKGVGIVQTSPPFLKGGVNFDYLPQRGGNLKNLKKEWKYGAGAGLLKRGTADSFPI